MRLGLLVFFVAAGCASQAPQPAVIAVQSAETLATLNAAASSLLNGRKVRLAKNAFTRTATLSVVPTLNNRPKGRLASGRTIVLPDELQLLRIGRRCELMHVATKARTPLTGIECTALQPST